MTILLLVLIVLLTNSTVFCENASCPIYCDRRVALYNLAEICLEKEWCKIGIWETRETVLRNVDLRNLPHGNASFVRLFPNIGDFGIRRCSVQNFEKLDTIFGENLGLAVIEVGAFWNLPGLRVAYLAFNELREVQTGTFSYLPIEILDLSWNKISHISEKAFEGMENLKSLNLSHNELKALDMRDYSFNMNELLLSHNSLTTIDLSYTLSVSILDLSFNKLTNHQTFAVKHLDVLDLTNNYLSSIKLPSGGIAHLRLSLNNFTDIGPFYGKGRSIGTIILYPNPWDCDELDTLLKNFHERSIIVLSPSVNKHLTFEYSYPVCATVGQDAYYNYEKCRETFIKYKSRSCSSDNQCPNFMICRTGRCYEPCKHGACHSNTNECITTKHKFTCKCPLGTLQEPYRLYPICKYPCREDSDCPEGRNGICGEDLMCHFL